MPSPFFCGAVENQSNCYAHLKIRYARYMGVIFDLPGAGLNNFCLLLNIPKWLSKLSGQPL